MQKRIGSRGGGTTLAETRARPAARGPITAAFPGTPFVDRHASVRRSPWYYRPKRRGFSKALAGLASEWPGRPFPRSTVARGDAAGEDWMGRPPSRRIPSRRGDCSWSFPPEGTARCAFRPAFGPAASRVGPSGVGNRPWPPSHRSRGSAGTRCAGASGRIPPRKVPCPSGRSPVAFLPDPPGPAFLAGHSAAGVTEPESGPCRSACSGSWLSAERVLTRGEVQPGARRGQGASARGRTSGSRAAIRTDAGGRGCGLSGPPDGNERGEFPRGPDAPSPGRAKRGGTGHGRR